jgi:hypothetical protein
MLDIERGEPGADEYVRAQEWAEWHCPVCDKLLTQGETEDGITTYTCDSRHDAQALFDMQSFIEEFTEPEFEF